jgi:hypothetical protein
MSGHTESGIQVRWLEEGGLVLGGSSGIPGVSGVWASLASSSVGWQCCLLGKPCTGYWLLFWSENYSVDNPQPPNGCIVWYPHSHVLSLVIVHSVRTDRGVPMGVTGEGSVGNEGEEYLSLCEVNGMSVEGRVLVSGAWTTRGLVLGCQLFLGATAMKCSNSANCGESMFYVHYHVATGRESGTLSVWQTGK